MKKNVRNFLDKNDSIINTTGHVVNFLQNRQTQKNQRVLAEMSAINASLLDQQNKIKQKELEAIEKLRQEQKKKEDEEKERQELKTYLLKITPQMKGLLQLIDEGEFDDYLQLGLLINHLEIRLQEISDNKAVIDDINFHDYVFNLIDKLKKFKKTYETDIGKYDSFLNNFANLLFEIRYSISAAELVEKNPAEIYKEKNDKAENYLLELSNKVKSELKENKTFENLIDELKRYKTLLKYLDERDSILETERYPLPLSYSETTHLIDTISEIKNDKNDFLLRIEETVKKYKSIVQDTEDSPFLRLKEISEKKASDLTLDDLEYVKNHSKTEHYEIFEETFSIMFNNLSKALVKDYRSTSKLSEVFSADNGNSRMLIKSHLHSCMNDIEFTSQIFRNNFNKEYILTETDNYSGISTLLSAITIFGLVFGIIIGEEDGENLGIFMFFLFFSFIPIIFLLVYIKKIKSLIQSSRQEVLEKIKKHSDILDLKDLK